MRKQPGELELFSTEELIDELMKRTTFQGVIVHADAPKSRHWSGERVFRVRINQNLGPEEASRLLDVVSQHIGGPERRLVADRLFVAGRGRMFRPPARCNASRFFDGRVGRRRSPPSPSARSNSNGGRCRDRRCLPCPYRRSVRCRSHPRRPGWGCPSACSWWTPWCWNGPAGAHVEAAITAEDGHRLVGAAIGPDGHDRAALFQFALIVLGLVLGDAGSDQGAMVAADACARPPRWRG